MRYGVAELMLYHTCNYNCGYCSFAEDGRVSDVGDMEPFRDTGYIRRILDFFRRHSDDGNRWVLLLSGGEPLLMPNLEFFAREAIADGHKLAYNTNLAVPVERNGWMGYNPPEAVDSIQASLHPEGLRHLDALVERTRILRQAGYPIHVRMVAHPRLLPRVAELDDRFRAVDVSLSLHPLWSPNYPRAYDAAQRAMALPHLKAHYEAVRFEGGLDMHGRQCRAGSGLICVGLGRSGGGWVYPCSSTTSRDLRLGNIFDDDVRLREGLTDCLRSDRCCTCAGHFTHDIIPSVDDPDEHRAMLWGAKDSIAATWPGWVEAKGIRMRSSGWPDHLPCQGTATGERTLVIDRAALRQDGVEVPLAPPSQWAVYPRARLPEGRQPADGMLEVVAADVRFDYLAQAPTLRLPAGQYILKVDVAALRGAVAVGLLDVGADRWLASVAIGRSGQHQVVLRLVAEVDVAVLLTANEAEGGEVSASIGGCRLLALPGQDLAGMEADP